MTLRFRDRDAPVTKDGLIFRTYGYDHPPNSCFCDLEYAPDSLYQAEGTKALRQGPLNRYYKFFLDGGLKFALAQDTPYQIYHRPLGRMMVGVESGRISHIMRPEARLKELFSSDGDALVEAAREVVYIVADNSDLRQDDFGVFGSLAHGFHSVQHSDVDLVVYGRRELSELRSTLTSLFDGGTLENEFNDWTKYDPPHHWNFTYLTKVEYGEYQRRKLIYARYASESLGRRVNVEFEPVRRWDEVNNEYGITERIEPFGRVEARAEVLSDEEGGFMPSVYSVRVKEVSGDVDPRDVRRVVSYVKEFRMQLEAGETALIRGNLERVVTRDEEFHQIALSYGPDYFDQVLKAVEPR
ncbi:MAG: nucleotidyltransferase domain-containing protein [Candidatus Bathyarchaeota archaeon]|nr:MAG: nucleotidyltransferase domain-containing protein [Candidatus Bathyarchaeota archaeon]